MKLRREPLAHAHGGLRGKHGASTESSMQHPGLQVPTLAHLVSVAFLGSTMEADDAREGKRRELDALNDLRRKVPHASASALNALLK